MFMVLVTDGVVVNRAAGSIPAEWSAAARVGWIENDVAQIGWTYDGTTFTAPPRPPDPVPTPAEVAAEARAVSFVADATRADLLVRLQTATPAQIDAWLLANVTTLVQARVVLGSIIKILALDGRGR